MQWMSSLKTQNPARQNNEEMENLNKPITSKEIEAVIRSLQQRKALALMASLVNSTKHLKT